MKALMLIVAGAGVAVGMPMGCQHVPGTAHEQETVMGGTGAALARGNPLLGALAGSALGAGGGYLVGAHVDRVRDHDSQGAIDAARQAGMNPATAEQAREAATADINQDGFVTMDEIIAMDRAGFSDEEMLERLEATDHIYELTPEQERYLVQRGVNQEVVTAMRDINREVHNELLAERQGVIGRPR